MSTRPSLIGAVGASGLLLSAYLPWYAGTSGEDFFGTYFGTGPGRRIGRVHVDLWWFHVTSAVVLALGLIALVLALARALGLDHGTRPFDRSCVFVSIATPVLVAWLMAFPPGPENLFATRYGAWVGLACSLIVMTSLLPKRSVPQAGTETKPGRVHLADFAVCLGGVGLLGAMYAPWWEVKHPASFVHRYFDGGGSSVDVHITVNVWWFTWQSAVLLACAALALLLPVLKRASSSPSGYERWLALALGVVATATVAKLLLEPPGPTQIFAMNDVAWTGAGACAVLVVGLAWYVLPRSAG